MPTRPLAALLLLLALACPLARPTLGDEPAKPTASATESNPAVPPVGHSVHGEAFDDGPRRHATRLPGMGKVDFPVTTSVPEVAALMNQGVAQLHSFYYYEAERSFRQAGKLDPANPMPYWGMAMANIENSKRAKGFLKEARDRASKTKPSQREAMYLDALASRFQEGDDKVRRQGYLAGLESIVQEFPADLDARSWLAMTTWQNESGDGIGSRQAVDGLIDSVLQAEPLHPGAHHYRIHLWDHKKVARAEKAAALYAKAAPGIAHAWHMPGHTYTELKRYADAAYQQEGSARVDHAAMLRDGTMPFEIHNYAHNNQWLATSLSHVGRVKDAVVVARNLVDQPRDPQKNGPNNGGSAGRSGRLRWAEVLARYELWDDLIAATESKALDWSDVGPEKAHKAYFLGQAYAAKGDGPRLELQIAALKAADAKPDESKAKPVEGAESTAAEPAPSGPLAELEGYRLLASGEYGRAFDSFARAPAMRREALARAHLAARNFGLAESVAKEAVAKAENQVAPLAACVEVLHAVGKDDEARDRYRQLAPLARDADADTPVFRRLAPIVAGWALPVDPAATSPTDEAASARVDLGTLGPLTWQPNAAAPISGIETAGATWNLADHRGRNVVVLFYLGGKCAHCLQQLQAFGAASEALNAAGTDLVAIGTDDLAASKALKANADGVKFPMPILADPALALFRTYHAFDEFEDRPLHATFLVDARGAIRFGRISADPFLDVEFIKAEAARVAALNR